MSTEVKYNARNFIAKTWLSDTKREAPFYYKDPADFYPKYDLVIKKVLDDPTTTVLITNDGESVTPYGGPFTLSSKFHVQGYSIVSLKDNSLWGLFAAMGSDDLFIKNLLFDRAFIHLGKPEEIYLPYPHSKMFQIIKRQTGRKNFKIKFPARFNEV